MKLLPPNKRQSDLRNQRGSILVICMVMAALGTIGVAAWISLLDARSNQVEANLSAVSRRVTYQNSRALASHAIYANHLHASTGVATNTTYTLPYSLGQITIQPYSTVPLQQSASIRHSNNGVTPARSFTTDVTVQLSDGIGNHARQFQLRNYNPVLGGELLSIHPPVDYTSSDTLISGSILVKGRATFWDAVQKDFSAGIRADEFLLPNKIGIPTTFSTSSNSSTLPLNYPIPLQTTGFGTSSPTYDGQLNITRSSTNQHNDYVTRILATGSSIELVGSTATSIGPGASSQGDSSDDTFLEAEVATQSPAYLETALPIYYPLSSRILKAVTEKNNPPFSEDQIYDIFSAHTPIVNDALTHLMGAYQSRIGSRTDELNRANGTWISVNGSGTARIYLESNALPHVILDQIYDLRLIGQLDTTTAFNASTLSPVAIVVANSSGFGLDSAQFEGENGRRTVLAISTDTVPAGGPGTYDPNFVFTSGSPFPDWHLILDLQNTGALIDTSSVSGATIIGGIRANRKIDVTSGSLTLEREYQYNGLETLLSRNAWVEAYGN